MLKSLFAHILPSPKILFGDWRTFFQEDFHRIILLHVVAIIGSYVINIFDYFSQWQISLIIILLRKLFAGEVCHSQKNLHGKVVIITGACSGIGKETAKQLSLKGAKIFMACCEQKRANQVAEELRNATGGEFHVLQLDLSSLKSVRFFVNEFRKDNDHLDYLINNAGVMMCPHELTEDGFEMQFGVNHLGHFLLTNLLLPLLIAAPQARIINVSSIMHLFASFDITNVNSENGYNRVTAYSNSKLANMLFTLSLTERLKDTNIQSFAVHPGVIQSQLGRHLPFCGDFLYGNVLALVFKSPSQGAQTTLYCALEANSRDGYYYCDCATGMPTNVAGDSILASQLWQISDELVGLQQCKREMLTE